MGREENITIFQDTERMYKTQKRLKEAVQASIAKELIILEGEEVSEKMSALSHHKNRYAQEAEVVVSKKRSFEAAKGYLGKKVCVHNFASASTPGGGVTKGSSAQEEALCRCSTLYPCLNSEKMWNGFYGPHRAAPDPLHNDDCIFTPGVIVFKTDTAMPKTMPEKDWQEVDVLTCAAPNLREKPSNQMNGPDGDLAVKISDRDLMKMHEKRLRRILDMAVAAGDEVVILGAFGCGAFRNNPQAVAQAAKNVIGEYLYSFETIEFAVYCSHKDERNYGFFERAMKGMGREAT